MTRPLLQLTGVTRRFPAGDRDVVVLRNVSLSIDAGEIVAIVGASGSGKSTLMNILGCLDHPSAGSYTVGGRETRTLEGVMNFAADKARCRDENPQALSERCKR
ncbi:ATP-binding cassette domain-containing protein, partial [Burkholderia ubonensis]|uniref:ATP-binding cassette domain-containing protein n=1 Tax=Burkholderia ubonensis TaxID=101571 RepID=UPI000AE049EA